ncbi:MAG: acetyl-CoA carboxylase biotin carboxyl carrier protein [Anaerovoracaceae bacterium]|jgi:acetyl-CoA carboxylase biotin carboxyl carrier protein
MEKKEIQQYLDWFAQSDLIHLEIETDDVKLRMEKPDPRDASPAAVIAAGSGTVSAAAAGAGRADGSPLRQKEAAADEESQTRPAEAAPEDAGTEDGEFVRSPLVGVFYRAPEPGAAPFVEEGSSVHEGDVLCVVEAMKMMNEIRAPFDLIVRRCLIQDGTMAEAGAKLFEVERC